MNQAKLKLNKVILFLAVIVIIGLIGYVIGANFPFKNFNNTKKTNGEAYYSLNYSQDSSRQKQRVSGLYSVAEVIDGDTIQVNINGKMELVRFIGINTPEVNNEYRQEECFGPEASKETKKLLSGKKVYLLPDPQVPDRGKYNRLLRYVFLPNGEFINAELVKDGYAFEYIYQPFQFIKYFHSLENEAREQRKGLWGDKCNYYSQVSE